VTSGVALIVRLAHRHGKLMKTDRVAAGAALQNR